MFHILTAVQPQGWTFVKTPQTLLKVDKVDAFLYENYTSIDLKASVFKKKRSFSFSVSLILPTKEESKTTGF